MTKIKNFRINLRPREVARLLKNQAQLQITPALEASIEHAINDSKRLLQPSAIYATLTRSTAEKTTPLPLADPAVSVSIIAATVGPALDEELADAVARQDTMQTSLLTALRDEALQQSVQFIVRLIENQAKEEECETAAPQSAAADSILLGSLGALLGVARIGIHLDSATPLLPPYSRLVWTVWSPKVRVKASKAASRTEKATASASA